MTQTLVLNKLAKFLEYYEIDQRSKLSPKDQEEFKKNIGILKQLFKEKGYCFGLSLIHFAMHEVGDLIWWEHVLHFIANWKEEPESLDTEIDIPGSRNDKNDLKAKKIKTILNRAINYIVQLQTRNQSYFPEMNQVNILQPEGYHVIKPKEVKRSYFEILDSKTNEIKRIQYEKTIAGNLTKDQLIRDIQTIPEKNIFIHSMERNHTIRLFREGAKWCVYDPNYKHDELPLHKEFATLENAIDEVIRIMGYSIAVQFVSFNKNIELQFPEYKNLLKNPVELLKNRSLMLIAYRAPDVLSEIFQQINDTNAGKALFQSIIEALPEKNKDGWTTLHLIIRFAPHAFEKLMNQINNGPEGKNLLDAIIQAISEQSHSGWTTLHFMARFTSQVLENFINQINSSSDGKKLLSAVIGALPKLNSDGWTVLHIMAKHTPSALDSLINQINHSSDREGLLNAFIEALPIQSKDGWATLHLMANFAPTALNNLINQINDSPVGEKLLNVVMEAILKQGNGGWTLLHLMIRSAQPALDNLIDQINKSPNGKKLLNVIIEALPKLGEDKWTLLHAMARHMPSTLDKLFNQIDGSPEGNKLLNAVIKILLKQTKSGLTPLPLMAGSAPSALKNLLDRIINSSNEQKKDFLKMVIETGAQTYHGDTTLEIIEQCSPQTLKTLSTLFNKVTGLEHPSIQTHKPGNVSESKESADPNQPEVQYRKYLIDACLPSLLMEILNNMHHLSLKKNMLFEKYIILNDLKKCLENETFHAKEKLVHFDRLFAEKCHLLESAQSVSPEFLKSLENQKCVATMTQFVKMIKSRKDKQVPLVFRINH